MIKKAQSKRATCSMLFLYLSIIFVVCLLLSNILAAKLLKVASFSVSAGVLVFPISYIINDILAEVYGYQKAKNIIICGFAMNIFMAVVFIVAIALPSPEWFENDTYFEIILGSAPRTVLAGLFAYLFGSLINAKVLAKMKAHSNSKFGVRAIISTVFGEATDSLIFVLGAFAGTISSQQMFGMMLIQVVMKTAYEIICLPLTILIVGWVREHEGITQEQEAKI